MLSKSERAKLLEKLRTFGIEITIELKFELNGLEKEEGGPFYFVIERDALGFFDFKYTNKRGKNVGPINITDEDLYRISDGLDWFLDTFDEEWED